MKTWLIQMDGAEVSNSHFNITKENFSIQDSEIFSPLVRQYKLTFSKVTSRSLSSDSLLNSLA